MPRSAAPVDPSLGWVDVIFVGASDRLSGHTIAEPQSDHLRVMPIASASDDVVLVDGPHPAGPAEGLFNRSFFQHCRRLLREVFGHADRLYGWVSMYPSGWWSWTFACPDGPRYREPLVERALADTTAQP